MKVLITGGHGQLGRALQEVFPDAIATDSDTLDITNYDSVADFTTDGVEAIINAAAYTDVDGAELDENAELAQAINVTGVENLAKKAESLNIPLVHVSTEYVFDGEKEEPYTETDATNPKSTYATTKRNSERAAQMTAMHYIVRTSWLIGDGKNFVKTMIELGRKGISPSVVDDQIGRLTFTDTLAQAIKHLLDSKADFGTYNATNDGQPASWSEITRKIFGIAGFDLAVTNVSTEQYFKDKENTATRPKNSVLSLKKIKMTGFKPRNWEDELVHYVQDLRI